MKINLINPEERYTYNQILLLKKNQKNKKGGKKKKRKVQCPRPLCFPPGSPS